MNTSKTNGGYMNSYIYRTGQQAEKCTVQESDQEMWGDIFGSVGDPVERKQYGIGSVINRSTVQNSSRFSDLTDPAMKYIAAFDTNQPSFGWGLTDERIPSHIVALVTEGKLKIGGVAIKEDSTKGGTIYSEDRALLDKYYQLPEVKSLFFREAKAQVCEAFVRSCGWWDNEFLRDQNVLAGYETAACIFAYILTKINEGKIDELKMAVINQDREFERKIGDFARGNWALCGPMLDKLAQDETNPELAKFVRPIRLEIQGSLTRTGRNEFGAC